MKYTTDYRRPKGEIFSEIIKTKKEDRDAAFEAVPEIIKIYYFESSQDIELPRMSHYSHSSICLWEGGMVTYSREHDTVREIKKGEVLHPNVAEEIIERGGSIEEKYFEAKKVKYFNRGFSREGEHEHIIEFVVVS